MVDGPIAVHSTGNPACYNTMPISLSIIVMMISEPFYTANKNMWYWVGTDSFIYANLLANDLNIQHFILFEGFRQTM